MKDKKLTVLLASLGVIILIIIFAVAIIDRITHSSSRTEDSQVNITSIDTELSPDIKIGNRIGNLGPDFTLNTTSGQQIKLSDFRGKHVILNFWATWCGPCQFEMPFLIAVDEEWSKAGVTVIAVSTQDLPEKAISYVKAKGIKFLVPLDPLGRTATLYSVRGMPTTFFINKKGIITSVKVGPFISKEEIEHHMASFK